MLIKFVKPQHIGILFIYCFFAGTIFSFAFVPYYILPFAVFSLTWLLYNIGTAKTKFIQFMVGYCFGLGHFSSSLYWIVYSLQFTPDLSFLSPIAIAGIAIILSIYIGLCSLVCGFFTKNRILTWLAFSCTWCLGEVIRSNFLLPFPWNLAGYIFAISDNILQFASIAGIYGLSFLLVLSSSVLYTLNKKAIASVFIIIIIIYSYGSYRLHNNIVEDFDTKNIRLVQPCTKPLCLNVESRIHSINQLFRLTLDNINDNIKYIIWPEGSFPVTISKDSEWPHYLANISKNKIVFLINTDSYINKKFYNSIIYINKQGDIAHKYDKTILVPFGEYIPLNEYWPKWIKKIAYGGGDNFTKGSAKKLISPQDGSPNFIALICYEAIFPSYITRSEVMQAEFILNTSNDIWFGNTAAPYQHKTMSRLRSIESGLPMLRVANNGVSFVTDAYGNIIHETKLDQQIYIDIALPKKKSYGTFYLLHQQGIIYFISLMFLCIIILEIIYKPNDSINKI